MNVNIPHPFSKEINVESQPPSALFIRALSGLSTCNDMLRLSKDTEENHIDDVQDQGDSLNAQLFGSVKCNAKSEEYRVINNAILRQKFAAKNATATHVWYGLMPKVIKNTNGVSRKFFVGGLPYNASMQQIIASFRQFGLVNMINSMSNYGRNATFTSAFSAGHVYVVLRDEHCARNLLECCKVEDVHWLNMQRYFFPLKPIGARNLSCNVELIPWCRSFNFFANPLSKITVAPAGVARFGANGSVRATKLFLNDYDYNNHVMSEHVSTRNMKKKNSFDVFREQNLSNGIRLHPRSVNSYALQVGVENCVFVGNLHGTFTAQHVFYIMNDLFDNVAYVELETDACHYPVGAAKVTFMESSSYVKALDAEYVLVKNVAGIKRVIQIEPYLPFGPRKPCICGKCDDYNPTIFCRDKECFAYYCLGCWIRFHHKHAPKPSFLSHRVIVNSRHLIFQQLDKMCQLESSKIAASLQTNKARAQNF